MINRYSNTSKIQRWCRLANHGHRQLTLKSAWFTMDARPIPSFFETAEEIRKKGAFLKRTSGNHSVSSINNGRRTSQSFLEKEKSLSPTYQEGEEIILSMYPDPAQKKKEKQFEEARQQKAQVDELKRASEAYSLNLRLQQHFITARHYVDGIVWALNELKALDQPGIFASFCRHLTNRLITDFQHRKNILSHYMIQEGFLATQKYWKAIVKEVARQKNDQYFAGFDYYFREIAKEYADQYPVISTIQFI